MRWVGHVADIEKMGNAYKILVHRHVGKCHLGDLGVEGMIILTILYIRL
jgi:hypothetical protein